MESPLRLCCHRIAAVSWGGPARCSRGETSFLLTRLESGYLLKQPGGASVIPGAGHPAAMCPVGELLSPPQSETGTGASGGSAVPGFCLLKRRKYKETYPWRFIPIKTLFPANHACAVDIHSKECCSSQKLYLWWILLLLS